MGTTLLHLGDGHPVVQNAFVAGIEFVDHRGVPECEAMDSM